MSKKLKETDFLSISARVRVMETRLLTAERMERMIDAKDAADAAKVLGECGYPDLNEVTPAAVEDMLAGRRSRMVISITFYPDINEYMGRITPQIIITHYR